MYQQIVVGTDGSAGANFALDQATELARLSGATLHVVSAHKMTTPYQLASASEVGMAASAIGDANEAMHDDAQRICDVAVERAKAAGVTVEAHCVPGDAADALLTVAKDTGVGPAGGRQPRDDRRPPVRPRQRAEQALAPLPHQPAHRRHVRRAF